MYSARGQGPRLTFQLTSPAASTQVCFTSQNNFFTSQTCFSLSYCVFHSVKQFQDLSFRPQYWCERSSSYQLFRHNILLRLKGLAQQTQQYKNKNFNFQRFELLPGLSVCSLQYILNNLKMQTNFPCPSESYHGTTVKTLQFATFFVTFFENANSPPHKIIHPS